VGLALLMENWLLLVLAAAAITLLRRRTDDEERQLLDKFGGDYRAYMDRTGRFFPRIR
jgi:protein-S-isoprenylcysteine O-methyltransferase Ste14